MNIFKKYVLLCLFIFISTSTIALSMTDEAGINLTNFRSVLPDFDTNTISKSVDYAVRYNNLPMLKLILAHSPEFLFTKIPLSDIGINTQTEYILNIAAALKHEEMFTYLLPHFNEFINYKKNLIVIINYAMAASDYSWFQKILEILSKKINDSNDILFGTAILMIKNKVDIDFFNSFIEDHGSLATHVIDLNSINSILPNEKFNENQGTSNLLSWICTLFNDDLSQQDRNYLFNIMRILMFYKANPYDVLQKNYANFSAIQAAQEKNDSRLYDFLKYSSNTEIK